MADSNNSEINRRDFISAAALATAGLSVLGFCGGLNSACAQATTQPSAPAGPLDVGPKASFDKDGATMTFVKEHHVIVMRENGKLYALTSKCTHRGADIQDAGTGLHCPRHNSDFAYDGTVIKGPAKTNGTLPRYAISVNDAGNVVVDTSKKFTQDQWDDPASFIAIAPAA